MRRMMFDIQIMVESSGIEMKSIELLQNRPNVGFLSVTDKFSLDDMYQFLLNSKDIHDSEITRCEAFPGEMLRPSFKNILLSSKMLDRLVEYYMASYEIYDFRKLFEEEANDSIIICVKINQFRRCRIGSKIFGSAISFRHIKSSYVLAKFMTNTNEVDCYSGQIQYFFKHAIDLLKGTFE